jgi:hypothetical protein
LRVATRAPQLISGVRSQLTPMVLVHRTCRVALVLGPTALLASCRPAAPTLPAELQAGTFVLTLRGTTGWPGRVVVLNEQVAGTACRVGNYIRLDSRDLSRRLLLWFPTLGPTPARHALATVDVPGTARGHLNHARYHGGSLHLVSGAAEVAAPLPDDVHATLHARLAQILIGGAAAPNSASVSGVFRAGACSDWGPQPASQEPEHPAP